MKNKILTFVIGVAACFLLVAMFFRSGTKITHKYQSEFHQQIMEMAQKSFSPMLYYSYYGEEKENNQWLKKQAEIYFPLGKYVEDQTYQIAKAEDDVTYQMLLRLQAMDEERPSEDLESEPVSGTVVENDLSLEKLRDFNYLISKLYTVDSNTTIGPEQLNAETLLAKDMHINQNKKGPKILIFHTHSQETFKDGASIVDMGAYLTDRLNALGIESMHHKGVYDLVNGKLDRSKAYELSCKAVTEILNQNPSIEVVIDLHRDGVREDLHLVTEINGKQTAKIMFFNGLSRTKQNGDIAYLYNPYIQDNLSFSLQMQLEAESQYPGFARRIYLKGYRYSLYMMPKSLLVEAGAQTNTGDEVRNAMDLLANTLNEVLTK